MRRCTRIDASYAWNRVPSCFVPHGAFRQSGRSSKILWYNTMRSALQLNLLSSPSSCHLNHCSSDCVTQLKEGKVLKDITTTLYNVTSMQAMHDVVCPLVKRLIGADRISVEQICPLFSRACCVQHLLSAHRIVIFGVVWLRGHCGSCYWWTTKSILFTRTL